MNASQPVFTFYQVIITYYSFTDVDSRNSYLAKLSESLFHPSHQMLRKHFILPHLHYVSARVLNISKNVFALSEAATQAKSVISHRLLGIFHLGYKHEIHSIQLASVRQQKIDIPTRNESGFCLERDGGFRVARPSVRVFESCFCKLQRCFFNGKRRILRRRLKRHFC